MKLSGFTCDVCGVSLDAHGKRFTLSLNRVPAIRVADGHRWDLCPECAARLKMLMSRNHETYGKPW